MDIEKTERAKYAQIWSAQSYRSKSASTFPLELIKEKDFAGNILEIGCGDGHSADILKAHGFDVFLTDITLNGLPENYSDSAIECTAWNTPFDDGAFNIVFSTDVLEHLPTEKVEDTLIELKRICCGWNFHQIATFPDRLYSGYQVHLTVKSIQWWHERFRATEMDYKLFERKIPSSIFNDKK